SALEFGCYCICCRIERVDPRILLSLSYAKRRAVYRLRSWEPGRVPVIEGTRSGIKRADMLHHRIECGDVLCRRPRCEMTSRCQFRGIILRREIRVIAREQLEQRDVLRHALRGSCRQRHATLVDRTHARRETTVEPLQHFRMGAGTWALVCCEVLKAG